MDHMDIIIIIVITGILSYIGKSKWWYGNSYTEVHSSL